MARHGGEGHELSSVFPQYSVATVLIMVTCAAIASGLAIAVPGLGPLLGWGWLAVCLVVVGLRNRSPGVVTAAIFLLVAPLMILPYLLFSGHPVPMDRLSQVRDGMSEQMVGEVLGKPTIIRRFGRRQDWVYSGTSWCIVTVRFDEQGSVVRVDHDH